MEAVTLFNGNVTIASRIAYDFASVDGFPTVCSGRTAISCYAIALKAAGTLSSILAPYHPTDARGLVLRLFVPATPCKWAQALINRVT